MDERLYRWRFSYDINRTFCNAYSLTFWFLFPAFHRCFTSVRVPLRYILCEIQSYPAGLWQGVRWLFLGEDSRPASEEPLDVGTAIRTELDKSEDLPVYLRCHSHPLRGRINCWHFSISSDWQVALLISKDICLSVYIAVIVRIIVNT